MREILFRGKRIDNGKWVQGAFSPQNSEEPFGPMIEQPSIISLSGPMDGWWFKVDPDTIGQYTGLTDKNGKKIFEGDVLSAYLDEGFPEIETRMIVVWDFCGFKMQYAKNVFDEFDAEDCGTIWEVIGNIHDNPELLEVAE